ncbi:MAG: hypothetical protein AAF975_07130, partial [Spirochaetota bacterium]
MNNAKSGKQIIFYKPTTKAEVTSGNLTAKSWYQITAQAASGSALPLGVGQIFKVGATAITLASGDKAKPIELGEPVAKTEVGIQFEEGKIDVTDSESGGYGSEIPDGFINFSGSLNGFLKYNKDTETMEDMSDEIFGRFVDKVEDDGSGNYQFRPRRNAEFLAFILLNKGADVGQTQHWLIMNVVLSSFDMGGGIKDAQKRDISVSKGSGGITLYRRVAGSGEVI